MLITTWINYILPTATCLESFFRRILMTTLTRWIIFKVLGIFWWIAIFTFKNYTHIWVWLEYDELQINMDILETQNTKKLYQYTIKLLVFNLWRILKTSQMGKKAAAILFFDNKPPNLWKCEPLGQCYSKRQWHYCSLHRNTACKTSVGKQSILKATFYQWEHLSQEHVMLCPVWSCGWWYFDHTALGVLTIAHTPKQPTLKQEFQ